MGAAMGSVHFKGGVGGADKFIVSGQAKDPTRHIYAKGLTCTQLLVRLCIMQTGGKNGTFRPMMKTAGRIDMTGKA